MTTAPRPVTDDEPVTDDGPVSLDPLWLSHHGAGQAERCVRLGPVHVCRRCLVLYPASMLWAVLLGVLFAGGDVPLGALAAAAWVAPVPLVLEWCAEHLGLVDHSPRRQITVTMLAAPGLGAALVGHLASPYDGQVVTPVGVWVGVCATVALVAWWRAHSVPAPAPGTPAAAVPEDWQDGLERAEHARRERLEQLLGEADVAAARLRDTTSSPARRYPPAG